MTQFLLEILSEEIPARMQDGARAELEKLFLAELAKAGVQPERVETYATPRRLALIAHGLPLKTRAIKEETKGPKLGAPPQALEGFLRKTGLRQEDLVERDGVYFAVVEKPGMASAAVLAAAIPAIIRSFAWPKSMRWGQASVSPESLRWVRPLQGIVALLGEDIVPCAVEGITSERETMGHRFMSAGAVRITSGETYAAQLRAAHVIVDQAERQAIVRAGAQAAAKAAGLHLVEDEGLVRENAGLTEWPVPLLGRFDAGFLAVPQEVIQLTARVNQKYFIARDMAGKLANAFICTANIEAHDGGAAIIAGNERVLAARLSDAKFFYEQDLKTPLAKHAEKLQSIVFHEKLGTVADKVERVAKLARWLCETGVVVDTPLPFRGWAGGGAGEEKAPTDVSKVDMPSSQSPSLVGKGSLADQAERAARLCKADLVTGMVGEFPELQGIMGGYYARAQGLPDAVADAIRDHYKPQGQGDDVPTAPVTVAVSLADKLDTIAGFFAQGMKPTGSKDPYALRRAALGVIQLLETNGLRGGLVALIAQSMWQGAHGQNMGIAHEILAFFIDRLKVQQREAGVRHDLIDAVFSLGGEDDLVRLLARVQALQAFISTQDGENLLSGYKRAANLLKSATTSSPIRGGDRGGADEGSAPTNVSNVDMPPSQPSPLKEGGLCPADQALLTALDTAAPQVTAALAMEDFTQAMQVLASLRAPIDQFFADVMVNDPDANTRAFRLGLLSRFRAAVHQVADFSKIEG